jgi:hypothetical protein
MLVDDARAEHVEEVGEAELRVFEGGEAGAREKKGERREMGLPEGG